MYYENPSNIPNASYFSDGLGADEQWTEPYMQYGGERSRAGQNSKHTLNSDRAAREDAQQMGTAQAATTPGAKSIGGVAGSARQQANALRGVSVHDGFPNPATDTSLQSLDLNTLLITHTATTYLMRLEGQEWEHLGIFDGDIVIVDRSLDPRPSDLVVWTDADRFVISYKNNAKSGYTAWGVVTTTIHQFQTVSRKQ